MTFSYKVNHIWWYMFVGNDCKKIHFQMRYAATSIRSKALVILIKLKWPGHEICTSEQALKLYFIDGGITHDVCRQLRKEKKSFQQV